MNRSLVFYLLLGFGVVFVPAVLDRLLRGLVADGWRAAVGLLAAVLTALFITIVTRLLGL